MFTEFVNHMAAAEEGWLKPSWQMSHKEASSKEKNVIKRQLNNEFNTFPPNKK